MYSVPMRRFLRKAILFQVATGAASVLQSIAGIILARALKPELFGEFSLAFSVASVASIILATGIQEALMPRIAHAHTNGDGDAILSGFGYWAKWIGVSVLFVVIAAALLPLVTTHLYGNAAIGAFAAVILFASLVSSSLLSIAQVNAQIIGRISTLSWLTLTDMIARYGVSVALVLVGAGVFGASFGHLVGAVLMAVVAWFVILQTTRKDPLLPNVPHILNRARTVSWRLHLSQGLWVWVDRNFGMLYQALPLVFIGIAVSVTQVAFFKLAFGYLNTAFALLMPLSVLLNTEFAKIQAQTPERLRSSFIKMSLGGMALAGVLSAFALLVGRWVFLFLYGVAYLPSVPLVYGLGVYGVLFGLGIGLGPMWRTLGRVRISVIINLCVLVVGIPLGLWLVHAYGSWGGVFMVTLWYAAAHLISFFYLLSVLKSRQ
jgi:O-antigen/teichoic acid export membrane protein